MYEAWLEVRKCNEYLNFSIYGCEGYIGNFIVYPNTTIHYYAKELEFKYCSVEKLGIEILELIEQEGWIR